MQVVQVVVLLIVGHSLGLDIVLPHLNLLRCVDRRAAKDLSVRMGIALVQALCLSF